MARRSAWIVAAAVLVFPVLLSAQEQKLPEGKGREILTSVCQQCHGLEGVLTQRHNEEEWTDLFNTMISNGAPLQDDEVETLAKYMAKNFGPDKPASGEAAGATTDASAKSKVNMNKSTSKELQSSLALSEKDADAIVSYRDKNGKFADLADLKKVDGVDSKKIEAAKERLEF